VRTLYEVFGFVSVWQTLEADYLLIAGREPFAVPITEINRRFRYPAVWEDLYRICLGHPGLVMGSYITSGEPLRQWASSAPIHTDDNALLEFSAPKNLHSDYGMVIAGMLADQQRSPFEEILTGNQNEPIYKQIQERVNAAAQIRRDWVTGMELWKKNLYAEAIELFLKSYKRFPDSFPMYRHVNICLLSLAYDQPDLMGTPEIQKLVTQAKALRMPIYAPLRGVRLSDMVNWLRSQAFTALQQGKNDWAVGYFREINHIDPDDGQNVISLTDVYLQSDRIADAVGLLDEYLQRHPVDGQANKMRGLIAIKNDDYETAFFRLQTALASGSMTISELNNHQFTQPVLNNPKFKALLQRLTQAQPASKPS